jgi:hypothetical protein
MKVEELSRTTENITSGGGENEGEELAELTKKVRAIFSSP